MTHREICAILKACVNSNIKELCIGDLKLSFFGPNDGQPYAATIPQPIRDPESLKSKIRQVEEATFERFESKIKDDELDQLLIEDPALYERLLTAGELEDGGDAGQEIRRPK